VEDKKSKHLKKLERYSKELNRKVPKSEIWFLDELKKRNIELPDMLHNIPFCGFIPDFRIPDLRIIIEIDGSYHQLKKQIQRDILKDQVYNKNSYTCIRVKHNDYIDLLRCFSILVDSISRYRIEKEKEKNTPKKYSKPKIVKKANRTPKIESLCYVCQQYKGKHVLEKEGLIYKLCGFCI